MGIDIGEGNDIAVEDRYIRPTPEYPDGSWLHTFDGEVKIATGYYAKEHPNKPSPYFHGGPPFVVLQPFDVPWQTDGGGPFDKAVDRVIKRVDRLLGTSDATNLS
jgi:hypothetical protein